MVQPEPDNARAAGSTTILSIPAADAPAMMGATVGWQLVLSVRSNFQPQNSRYCLTT
jgi:hypothetical protein